MVASNMESAVEPSAAQPSAAPALRVAWLSPLPPEQTGIADYAATLSAALRAQGVEVLFPYGAGASTEQACAAVRALLVQGAVDVVHAELGGGRVREFAALATAAAVAPGVHLSATVHDPERLVWRAERLPGLLEPVARWHPRLRQLGTLLADPALLAQERRLAQALSTCFTLTQTGREVLSARMRLSPSQTVVIPHGVHAVPAQPLPPLQPLKLLYFGFIYRGKGIEDILQALAGLLARGHIRPEQVQLTLAGGTSPEMAFGGDNYLQHLQKLLQSLNLQALVHLVLDVPEADISALIQAHHVMILPYRESKKLRWLGQMRGTSGALAWATACGRGAITSSARAFAEEVAAGNGVVFPDGDLEALTARLAELLTQPEQAQTWAEAALRKQQGRHWPEVAAAMIKAWSRPRVGPAV